MAGAGSSIENITKKIGELAEQTTQAKQMTSLAIDRIYKNNIKLDSFIKATGKGTIQVNFTFGNLSPLPIKSAKATLKLEHPNVDIHIAKEANIFDDSNLETHVTQSFFDTPIDLDPQTEYEQRIELSVSRAVQCDGVIEISLSNLADPSSSIIIRHAFGIYLIDQLVVGEVDELKKESLDVRMTEEYPIEFVREIMNIHPIQGIDLGTQCQYFDTQNVITCEVIRVSMDNNDATIQFSGNDRDFLALFITELNKVKIKTGDT